MSENAGNTSRKQSVVPGSAKSNANPPPKSAVASAELVKDEEPPKPVRERKGEFIQRTKLTL